MSGHSKWSTIKRKKGANDAARGRVFGKISKEIMIAVQEGGGDPDANIRLRTAIIKGHAENMPNTNIERAIKKALGDGDKNKFASVTYEGYAPGGVAVLVECLTDNKNRTGPEVRHIFTKYEGNLGANGCVSYMFHRKGMVVTHQTDKSIDDVLEDIMECDVEDIEEHEGMYEITTTPDHFDAVVTLLKEKSYVIEHAEIMRVAETEMSIADVELEKQASILIEQMELLDDVQSVSHNLSVSLDDE